MSGWRPEEGGGEGGEERREGEGRCCFHSRHPYSDRSRVTQTSLTSVCLCVCVGYQDILESAWGWMMRGEA